MSFTENSYEQALIGLFQQLGYKYLYAPHIERDYSVPFWENQLLQSLTDVNPSKSLIVIEEAVSKLKSIDTGSLAKKNELFTDYLQHGIEVSYYNGREQKNEIVYLIDYNNTDRNTFQINGRMLRNLKNVLTLLFLSMDFL